MINTNRIGKFYLGAGGIGDCLLLLSTFYDNVEEANVIFLANSPELIKELLDFFPKIKSRLVIKNNYNQLLQLYYDKNCIGTGILPKSLSYSAWYKVDIFKEYRVIKYPKWVELFDIFRISTNGKKQVTIQIAGSNIEGEGKQRILTQERLNEINSEFSDCNIVYLNDANGKPAFDLKTAFRLIRGSDIVVSTDSFAKTFSTLCGIKTIVYDNIYSKEYLSNFKDNIDYGHYIFIFPWETIELRKPLYN
jgi:hypothetical protein